MNRNVILVGLLVMAALGFMYWRQQQQAALERAQREDEERKKLALQAKQAREGKIPVLIVKVQLPANTRITAEALRTESVPKEFVPDNARISASEVVGKYTAEMVYAGDILIKDRITDQVRDLESFLQQGERFYSIKIDGISAVSGFVKQGDRVDVVATFQRGGEPSVKTVLSNLEIFSVNHYKWELSAEERRKGDLGGLTITFKVTGAQASRLIQLRQLGLPVRLVLRPPSDLDKTFTKGWKLSQIEKGQDPNLFEVGEMAIAGAEGEPPPQLFIQVYRYKDLSTESFPITTAVTVPLVAAEEAALPAKVPEPQGPR